MAARIAFTDSTCSRNLCTRCRPYRSSTFVAISRPEPAMQGHVVMISGILDRLVPPYVAYDYAREMRDKREAPVELVDIPQAGHFDLVTLGTLAWAEMQGCFY